MSKAFTGALTEVQTATQKIAASFKQEVVIQKYQLSQDEMVDFIEHVKAEKAKDSKITISLTDYITDNFYAGQKNIVVVPDLSGLTIGSKMQYDKVENITIEDLSREHESYLDLSGVDFTGANIKGAKFEAVNLASASFCDTDLSDVTFNDCYMPGADMRGADISNCSLKVTYLEDRLNFDGTISSMESSELDVHNNRTRYAGMHFSTLEPLMHQYSAANEDVKEIAENRYNDEKLEKLDLQEAAIIKQQKQVNDKYQTLGYLEYLTGSNVEYNILSAELTQLQDNKKKTQSLSFEKDFDESKIKYFMHPSVAALPLIMSQLGLIKFDPAYKRGSDKAAREQEKQYVRLTRKDAESYIEAIKDNPQLTMNEFAESKISEKNINVKPGAKVIADFSTYIEDKKDALYSGVAVDLSGLDFSKANLQEACFAGAKLEGAIFNEANLSLATFEGANLEKAKFAKTTARDVNMFAASIDYAEFSGADFGRAYLSHSSAHEAQVSKTNFNFADIRNGLWDGAQVNDATFNYADLEGISLANAVIKKTSMQHANLDRAILEGCEMIETDLTFSFMAEAKASNLKLKNSILQDVDARKIDLSGATIDTLCKLKGVDLENAILKEVEADRVNFVGANMKGVDATGIQLKEAILEGVNMQFSNLEDAVMLGVKANGVDMTGSNLINIKARGAKLQGAVLEGVVAHNADLTEAVMEGANLRGSKMRSAILEKVNLQKADLRNAELEKAKLSEAKMDKAKVNDATNLHGADITNVKGNLEHEAISGKKTEMSPGEKVRRDNQVHKAKQVGAVGKLFGNICKITGHYTKKTGEFIKQPLSGKGGLIIGAIVGVGSAGALGLTGGLGLVVLAGVVTASAGVGAVAGHYAAKHTGLSTIAGIGAGLVSGGTVGAVLGGGVAIGANQAVKLVAGKSIDELVGNAITKVGEVVSLGSSVGISAEQEKLLDANKHANNSYKAPVLEVAVSENISQTREQNRMQKKSLAQSQSIPKSLERPVINAKIQVTKPKLQAKEVGKKLNNNLKNKVEVSNNTTSIKKNKGVGKS